MKQRFPNAPTPWLDLSTGINPWPYPNTQTSLQALSDLPTQASYSACQTAMAAAIDVRPEDIALAPGSESLIRLLPALLEVESLAILAPSYSDHVNAWRASGRNVIESSDPLALADQVDALVICNPNNPDGRTFNTEALAKALTQLKQRGGWMIIDEAYADLYPDLSLAPHVSDGGLIILRSFGKFFGLAGLRLGGLIAPPAILDKARVHLGSWPVSGAALEIGTRAYADLEWQTQTRRELALARKTLDHTLQRAGLTKITGTDLFRFVETNGDAHALWERLAHEGIYTRRFEWTRDHLRIGLPGDVSERSRLLDTLKASM